MRGTLEWRGSSMILLLCLCLWVATWDPNMERQRKAHCGNERNTNWLLISLIEIRDPGRANAPIMASVAILAQ